jgi:hypothetical protein
LAETPEARAASPILSKWEFILVSSSALIGCSLFGVDTARPLFVNHTAHPKPYHNGKVKHNRMLLTRNIQQRLTPRK